MGAPTSASLAQHCRQHLDPRPSSTGQLLGLCGCGGVNMEAEPVRPASCSAGVGAGSYKSPSTAGLWAALSTPASRGAA